MNAYRLFLLPILGVLPQSTPSPDARSTPPPTHGSSVAVVELFTSEGCSSCPPADKLLREVHLRRTADGELIVGISEHVTYWNQLGWHDPYSAEVFTQRQEAYAARLAPQGPYTPEMVVNGRDSFVGSDAAALQHALQSAAMRPHLELSILSTALAGHQLTFTFSLKSRPEHPVDLMAVVADDADRTGVPHGRTQDAFWIMCP